MGTKIYDNANDLITFSRASGGTYLDSDGLLKTASTNIPRIEYDAAGVVKGLLIEESRTNLVTESGAPVTAPVGASVAGGASTSPSGSVDALSLIESATTGSHYFRSSVGATTPVDAQATFSMYAKSAGRTKFQMFVERAGASEWAGVTFDLSDGTYSTTPIQNSGATFISASVESVGSGWYRCSVTGLTDIGQVFNNVLVGLLDNVVSETVIVPSYTGDGVSGIYFYGLQVEAGSFPTSYIPTSGATATRAADIASIPTSAFGYNQKQGSVVVEWTQATWGGYVAMLSDGTAANRAMISQFTDGPAYFSTITNNVAQGDLLSGTSVEGAYNKAAATLDLNNAGVSLNGAATVVDATYAVPTVTTLSLGSYTVAGSTYINGHIKSIQYYPRRLTNAQLQELTT